VKAACISSRGASGTGRAESAPVVLQMHLAVRLERPVLYALGDECGTRIRRKLRRSVDKMRHHGRFKARSMARSRCRL